MMHDFHLYVSINQVEYISNRPIGEIQLSQNLHKIC